MPYKNFIYLGLTIIVFLLISYLFQDMKIGKGTDTTVNYELVKDWPKLPKNMLLGNPTGLGIDTDQNVLIFHRASRKWPLLGFMPENYIKEKTVLIIDRNSGNLLQSWGANTFIMPHGLAVDKSNHVWVTDVGLHQVFKFTHEGKLLLTLGEAKISGTDKAHFNQPTDITIAKDGSFYVSDGYKNSRIVKFSANGKYLFEWGQKGTGEREFNIPHAIDLDSAGNVYVADRENDRIQVFNATGKFLKQFSNKTYGRIFSVTINKSTNKAFAIDDLSFLKIKHRGSDVIKLDVHGNMQTRFGRSGSYNG